MDIKCELNDRGLALNMRCRDSERIVKVDALSDPSGDDPPDAEKGQSEDSDRTIAYTQHRGSRGCRYRAQGQSQNKSRWSPFRLKLVLLLCWAGCQVIRVK